MSQQDINAYQSLTQAEQGALWALFPEAGVLLLGNVSDSAAICAAAGGGAFADAAGVARIAHAHIDMYFCAALRWWDGLAGFIPSETEALRAIVGNYSSPDTQALATGPYRFVWSTGGGFPFASGALALSPPAAGALGKWWWVPVVGALAATVVG